MGLRVDGSRIMVQGLKFRVQLTGFKTWVYCKWINVWGSGSRVQGSGVGV